MAHDGVVVTVASGKGGMGKTTVATNLALALADEYPVQFLDLDVEEPDAHLFLEPEIGERQAVTIKRPLIDETRCDGCGRCAERCEFNGLAVVGERVLVYDEICHGCGLCSLVCPQAAISERDVEVGVLERGRAHGFDYLQGILTVGEPLATPLLGQLKRRIDRTKVAILDAPPGTGCPVIEAMEGSDIVLMVTEPTPFGLHDLKLTVGVARSLDLEMAVVLNRDGIGNRDVVHYCRESGLPIEDRPRGLVPFRARGELAAIRWA